MRFTRTLPSSSRTATAVSSQEVSMPRIMWDSATLPTGGTISRGDAEGRRPIIRASYGDRRGIGQALRAERDRAAALCVLGEGRILYADSRWRTAEVFDRHSAAERDRAAAYRARARQHAAGHPRALEADERLQHGLAS